jgi:hypothetical protein
LTLFDTPSDFSFSFVSNRNGPAAAVASAIFIHAAPQGISHLPELGFITYIGGGIVILFKAGHRNSIFTDTSGSVLTR